MQDLFAYNNFDNDIEFLKTIHDMSHQEASVYLRMRSKLLNAFDMHEDKHDI